MENQFKILLGTHLRLSIRLYQASTTALVIPVQINCSVSNLFVYTNTPGIHCFQWEQKLASSQSCHSVDADAWCKLAFKVSVNLIILQLLNTCIANNFSCLEWSTWQITGLSSVDLPSLSYHWRWTPQAARGPNQNCEPTSRGKSFEENLLVEWSCGRGLERSERENNMDCTVLLLFMAN